jgi:tRNA A-37 threonylcarbamoyl transferase component Bud32
VAEPLEAAVTRTPGRTLHLVRVLRTGGPFKADITRVTLDGVPAVLKDFSAKPWAARLLGRRQVAREWRALERLRGVPGVPACHGAIHGGLALLLERMEGERITRFCQEHPEGIASMFARLERLVASLHERGVVHNDLRKRDNILVTPDGTPCVIDFNASFCLRPDRGIGRRLLGVLRRVDEGAILKWKARLAPALLSAVEARRHRVMSRLRRLWFFN